MQRHGFYRVKFLGLRPDLESIIQMSDIAALPLAWEKAFGLLAAEASSCGFPVVASNTGGLPEVVLHQRTGILIPPGDVPALVQALEKLISEPNTRRVMGREGRKHAEKNFDLHKQVAAVLSLYKSYLPIPHITSNR